MNVVILTGHTLTLEQVKRVLYQNEAVIASKDSIDAVKKAGRRSKKSLPTNELYTGLRRGLESLVTFY